MVEYKRKYRYQLTPPSDYDWIAFKKRLDLVFRHYYLRRCRFAIHLLDRVYDDWQKGKRTLEMIEALKEVDSLMIEEDDADYRIM